MQSKFMKIISALLVAFFVLLGISLQDSFTGLFESGQTQTLADEKLEIDFLDVGQGDSILIKTPENLKILIDGGPDNSVLNVLGENLSFFDNQIDIVILTHPHSDHVAGLVEVLRRYQVKEVYYSGAVHTTDDYLAWLKELKDQEIPIKIVRQPFDLELGQDLKLEFLYPNQDFTNQRVEELNNTSIVNRLVYKDKVFLFMGDAEIEVENELLKSGKDLSADLIKLGHHGSSTSSSEDFLHQVNFEFAIISCGQGNSFGHPSLIVLNRLERLGVEYFRTDLMGTIKVVTDGNFIQIN